MQVCASISMRAKNELQIDSLCMTALWLLRLDGQPFRSCVIYAAFFNKVSYEEVKIAS